ncbi:hypothetical protein ACXOM1_01780 [Streptococcus thermophilus]|uniref:hypothetical protein n=1 Tax=Streptococcus thermophilus TaxID=1308 RepID=UPI0022F0E6B3|nr:hypothetical protein [Streptococcus thermophilus]MDA3719949.1 hypothetical protein [Streptococcus thermophilus]
MKRKKYNKKVIIMTFVLMTIFSFLTILSKHSKEPVKPETKTHHSSSFQSSKNARLIRKLPPTLRQLPRRMIKQGILKRRIRIKHLLLLNNQVRSKMAIRLLIKKALKKNQIPLKGDEVGAVQKMVHMLLLKAVVVGAVQKTDHMSLTAMENVFNLAHSMKSMSGALMLTTVLTSIHNLHQALTQV